MNFLIVSYSAAKPSRYYLNGKRVSQAAYWDAADSIRSARGLHAFASRTNWDADGNATLRQYCCG